MTSYKTRNDERTKRHKAGANEKSYWNAKLCVVNLNKSTVVYILPTYSVNKQKEHAVGNRKEPGYQLRTNKNSE